MMRPSFTITAPTSGFGLVQPVPLSASASARAMKASSRASCSNFWDIAHLQRIAATFGRHFRKDERTIAKKTLKPKGSRASNCPMPLRWGALPIFFHPDCNCRLRNFTESAASARLAGRGLYHRWGLSPRPEDHVQLLIDHSALWKPAQPTNWEICGYRWRLLGELLGTWRFFPGARHSRVSDKPGDALVLCARPLP